MIPERGGGRHPAGDAGRRSPCFRGAGAGGLRAVLAAAHVRAGGERHAAVELAERRRLDRLEGLAGRPRRRGEVVVDLDELVGVSAPVAAAADRGADGPEGHGAVRVHLAGDRPRAVPLTSRSPALTLLQLVLAACAEVPEPAATASAPAAPTSVTNTAMPVLGRMSPPLSRVPLSQGLHPGPSRP